MGKQKIELYWQVRRTSPAVAKIEPTVLKVIQGRWFPISD